jgi:L-amino acid N-acyltransferase YncA
MGHGNPALAAPEHRNVGFTEIGILKNVGYKFGKYIDVGLWQMSVV